MGYAYYTLPDGREAGYGIIATCDAEGCTVTIDRGLGYLCGRLPDGHRDFDEYGCGRYFCHEKHHHPQQHDCPNPRCAYVPEDTDLEGADFCDRGTHHPDGQFCSDHRQCVSA